MHTLKRHEIIQTITRQNAMVLMNLSNFVAPGKTRPNNIPNCSAQIKAKKQKITLTPFPWRSHRIHVLFRLLHANTLRLIPCAFYFSKPRPTSRSLQEVSTDSDSLALLGDSSKSTVSLSLAFPLPTERSGRRNAMNQYMLKV